MSKLNKKNRLYFIGAALVFGVFGWLILSSFRTAPTNPFGLTKVVIDAGHGGHDSGCLGKNSKEKDIALGIALKLGKYIEENFPDVKVIYTRKTDQFVELFERASIANNAKADLFICIHCNSACFLDRKRKEVCNTETSGVETWVMGLHKTEANLEVAKRENEVVLLEKDYVKKYDGFDPNSPEANIIFSLYQNAFIDQSLRMASYVQREVQAKGRPVRGVKQAGFLVLFKTSMPSVLIETGFLSNPDEEKFLASEYGQDKMASAIYRAFRSYKMALDNPKGSIDFGVSKSDEEVVKVKEVGSNEGKTSTAEEGTKEKEDDKSDVKKKIAEKDKSAKAETTKPVMATTTGKQQVLIWGVQFYSSPKRLRDDHPRFMDVRNVRVDFENQRYKYSSGQLKDFDSAVELQSKLRKLGFKDAFVVAFYKDKKITMKEAMQMRGKD